MKSEKFIKEITVPSSAIDDLNHVNNVIYLQWCLEAAEEHWLTRTTPEIRSEYVWVVLNHFISYQNMSFEGDHLRIETWIENYDGVKSERRYKIVRSSDNKTIIEAKTLWCFLNAKTQRPTKIPAEISNLF